MEIRQLNAQFREISLHKRENPSTKWKLVIKFKRCNFINSKKIADVKNLLRYIPYIYYSFYDNLCSDHEDTEDSNPKLLD